METVPTSTGRPFFWTSFTLATGTISVVRSDFGWNSCMPSAVLRIVPIFHVPSVIASVSQRLIRSTSSATATHFSRSVR